MLVAILCCFIVALGLLFFGEVIRKKGALLLSLLPLGIFVFLLQHFFQYDGTPIHESYNWVPSLGISLNFSLNSLSLLFGLMISFIGVMVFVYTSYYLKGNEHLDRFYGYLSVFMGAMLGLVFSDNLIVMFIFWELTSISSFFLIGFNHAEAKSRASAMQALSITGLGGLFLLAAGLMLGASTGTFSFEEIVAGELFTTNDPWFFIIMAFVFVAAFTKSAQFPFHFWLPGAMAAPTPVSTYLHSATMVKAGVFILIKFSPLFASSLVWNQTLMIFGGITMVYAAYHTLFKTDLKGILAYSTISALGVLVFLIGLGTHTALVATLVFIVVHALYKATLFLITGIIDHETGSRDVTKLSGLRLVLMPVAIAGGLAALSNAGVPPFAGFVAKDLIYEATLLSPFATVLTAVAVVTNILLLYAGFQAGIRPFWGSLPSSFSEVHLPSWRLWVPPLLLASMGFVFGLAPHFFMEPLIAYANEGAESVHLALWHGFNLVLLLSGLTLLFGFLLYKFFIPAATKETWIQSFESLSPKSILTHLAIGFGVFARYWTNFFQNGYLRNYVRVVILFLALLVGYQLLQLNAIQIHWSQLGELTFYEIIIVLVMLGGILMAVFSDSRLTAVAAMGVFGFGLCMLFVFYSAPDLAMTQFAIDTLTVILFVLVLYRLPKYLNLSEPKQRLRDGILAIGFGGVMTLLSLAVLMEPKQMETGDFYAESAYLMAKGKNVVNVILVDFRGIDTLVEVTVLVIAALGVFGLLKLRVKNQ